MSWPQTYAPFALGPAASALVAAIPIAVVLALLGVMRKPSWVAGLSGLAVTFLLAVTGFHMPVLAAVSSAAEGACFGLFPITWIVLWAICLFRVTLATGKFEIIKDSVGDLTADPRLQALLIAFAFGAFIEGAAGFGTPVAIATTMLTGLGFTAFDASALCLLANTAPVAFGSIGIPIITLALTTGLPVEKLSAAAGILCPPVSLILPAYLIVARWGLRGLSGIVLPVVAAGTVFAVMQFAVATYVSVQLTDIIASISTLMVLFFLVRLRRYRQPEPAGVGPLAQVAGVSLGDRVTKPSYSVYSRSEILYAWLPYIFLIFCVLLWGWPPAHNVFETLTFSFRWPWLHDVVLRMPPIVPRPSPYHAIFNMNWCAASGTSCMVATLLTAAFFRMPPAKFLNVFTSSARQLLLPTVTVASVLAMAFLMNYCGATATLGLAFAATGSVFPFFSAILGWIGVFLTGSDTSSNALFGNLQTVTAERLGLNPVTLAAANSIGGVMGKMISLQTIAVAAAATGISVADQSRLFRFTLRHSILLVCLVGVIAMLVVYVHF